MHFFWARATCILFPGGGQVQACAKQKPVFASFAIREPVEDRGAPWNLPSVLRNAGQADKENISAQVGPGGDV